MSECLDCRACEAVCPSGVAYGQAARSRRARRSNARTARYAAGRAQARRAASRSGRCSATSALMRAVAWFLRFYQRSGLQALRARPRAPALARPRRSSRRWRRACPTASSFPAGQRWKADGAERKLTAFMHAGCVMHVAFADVDEATVRVLQRAGCDVVAPADQGCCGAIAVHAGELDLGRELAKRNIVAFERSGADVYVDQRGRLRLVAQRVRAPLRRRSRLGRTRGGVLGEGARRHGTARRARDLRPNSGPSTRRSPIRTPCHLAHAQRITAAPRRLLAQIPGLVMREMDESSLCCGSAGIYNVTQPEMAERLQARKIEQYSRRRTGASSRPRIRAARCRLAPGCGKPARRSRSSTSSQLIDESYVAGARLRRDA